MAHACRMASCLLVLSSKTRHGKGGSMVLILTIPTVFFIAGLAIMMRREARSARRHAATK
jgi:hypothetical protein